VTGYDFALGPNRRAQERERVAAEAAATAKRAEEERKAVAEAQKIVAIWNARQAGGRALWFYPTIWRQAHRAIADYGAAIALNPNYAEAFYNRALAYRRKGDIDHALADYDRSIGLDAGNPAAFNNRGDALMQRGRYERALEDFDRAIELNGEYAIAFINRGLVYRNKGLTGRAVADFRRALALKPDAGLRSYVEKALKELGAKPWVMVLAFATAISSGSWKIPIPGALLERIGSTAGLRTPGSL
jgi:tetratricopeptide (TPR) repeat protein